MLEIILVIVGLTICFGGIYFKKVVAGLTGLSWGAGIGFILLMLIDNSEDIETTTSFIIVAIVAIIMAALMVKFDRFCACVNMLFSSLSFFFVTLLFMTKGEFLAAIAISIILALIATGISFKFYDYSFVISTALTGGFVASLGGVSLFNDASVSELVAATLFGSDKAFSQIIAVTVVLAVIGTIVQIRRLNALAQNR